MEPLIAAVNSLAPGAVGPRIAVTGHQELGGAATEAFLTDALRQLLGALRRDGAAPTVLSGLAAGADTLFAEAALAEGCRLEACLACAEIEANFAPGAPLARFRALRHQCAAVHRLPFVERSNAAYMALGRWLVDTGDLLVAAWNGLPAVAEGGTGDVVAYALERGRPVVHLHTRQHRLAMLAAPLPKLRQ